ncbi:hypothetical protein MVLG_04865 [Microbotryum lychnidis-dioicae p1A1 Lamole]|uniref:RING-type domain-containing protein n=1 Tax=Microbotryum lychnidis-dioicae (strain p1A1 Lamole / MvSl-1064) TaxID=683840 RepID=U5HCI4_USTV1|nr:hypothetical protein MVLG_04865 [Microbotryum lychnidis-dioicae p1A1 Lamole]|eukprot:KDE04726.1 hypothetical protein MVLG_04865 [Microbotryum lychnidis-dioicae p1A1 Lamole]
MPSSPPLGPPLGEQGPSRSERASRSSSRRASPVDSRASSPSTHSAQPVASTSAQSGATSSESQRTPGRQLRFNPIVSSAAHRAAGASSSSAMASTSAQMRQTPRVIAASQEFIDLTDDSPPVVGGSSSRRSVPNRPTRHPRLALPGGYGHRLRAAAAQDANNATASTSGSSSGSLFSVSGANTRARRGTRAGVGQPSMMIELSSGSSSENDDDFGDDDIQVIEPVGGSSSSNRRITRANAQAQNGGSNAERRYENGYVRPSPRNLNDSIGNNDNDTSGDAAMARALAAAEDQAARRQANNAGEGNMFLNFLHGNGGAARNGGGEGGGGGGILPFGGGDRFPHPSAHIFALYPGLPTNFGYIDYGFGDGFNIGGLARGLAGVIPVNRAGWGGQDRVRAGKKYAIKMSHPRKVESGFSRDIVEPIDPNAPPAPTTSKRGGAKGGRGKAKDVQVIEMEPVCASCLDPFLLAQSGNGRPWALRCGHCVCGKCVNEARSRAKLARMGHWTEVDLRAESNKGSEGDLIHDVGNVDEDDLEYIDFGSSTTNANGGTKRKAPPTTTTTAAATSAIKKRKGKQKSMSEQTRIVDDWTSCPVVGCMDDHTNVLAPEGDLTGPFELFV